jgi:hypothetical protein
MLLFELSRPARIRVTVYGPGPSCGRLGTFGRRGQAGVNRVRISGSLYGRPLPAGRYAIVVEAVRAGQAVRIGRVIVTILSRDGREGGNRPLVAPDCAGAPGGDSSRLGWSSGSASGSDRTGGVAGERAARNDDDLSLLSDLPGLPALGSILVDPFKFPPWAVAALAVIAIFSAAAIVALGFQRFRDGSWTG